MPNTWWEKGIRRPDYEEVRRWIKGTYGNVYWRGSEIPIWDPNNPPPGMPKIFKRRYDSVNKWEANHMMRVDLAWEKDKVVFLGETDPVPLMSSIGQLKVYKRWLPECYPEWFTGKKTRTYLFVRAIVTDGDRLRQKAAKKAGIRTIVLK